MFKRLMCCLLALLLFVSAAFAAQVDTMFPLAFGRGETPVFQLTMEDDWFLQPSDVYCHPLAQLSMGLAVSAFRDDGGGEAARDHLLEGFLARAGFEDYASWEYDVETTSTTIACGIAEKCLPDGSTLLAVGVSGQGYANEWMSNFAVGAGERHLGFTESAAKVTARIHAYMAERSLEPGRVKLWIAGFSRAAAVSNMTAAMLLQEGVLTPQNIFCYAFATPANTAEPEAYPQIHNICGSMDVVPQVPLANWGYGRYGVTYYLPSMENDSGYEQKVAAAMQVFEQITGYPGVGFRSSAQINWLLSKVIELLYDLFPHAADYAEAFQQVLINTYGLQGGVADKLQYMITAVQSDPALLASVTRQEKNALTLITSILYTFLSEMTGENKAAWLNDIESAANVIHEHLPDVYLAWLLSVDDERVLFDHPLAYTRVIWSGSMDYAVTDSRGRDVTDNLSMFLISNQHLLTIPADDAYTVTLTAAECEGQIAVRRHSVDHISQDLMATDGMHFFQGETVTIQTPIAGAVTVQLDGSPMALTDHDGLQSICTEIVLNGNQSRKDLDEFLVYLGTEIIPHMVCYVGVLIYILAAWVLKLRRKTVNAPYQAVKPWGTVLKLMGAACVVNVLLHGVMLAAYAIIYSDINITSPLFMRVSRVLGVSEQAYEVGGMLCYVLLAALCFRGARLARSRVNGLRLCVLMLVLNLMQAVGGAMVGNPSPYEFLVLMLNVLAAAAFAKAGGPRRKENVV